jgi:RNA polymerase sigma-70 factor (ECF subfamily)
MEVDINCVSSENLNSLRIRVGGTMNTTSTINVTNNHASVAVPVRTTGNAQAQTVHNIPVGESPSGRGRLSASQARQFEKMILPHEGSLFGPAMALTRSASDAEDLVQDTLLRAYDRFETFRADGSPRAWLHTIMRNLFYNAYRKKSREPRQVSLEFFDPANGDSVGTSVTLQGAPSQPTVASPERQVLSQMEGAAVLEAVKSLPSEYRQVVVMADIQGLPYQEIADTLHIPVGTVRSRLSRGRERVRKAVFAWRPSEVAPPHMPTLLPA